MQHCDAVILFAASRPKVATSDASVRRVQRPTRLATAGLCSRRPSIPFSSDGAHCIYGASHWPQSHAAIGQLAQHSYGTHWLSFKLYAPGLTLAVTCKLRRPIVSCWLPVVVASGRTMRSSPTPGRTTIAPGTLLAHKLPRATMTMLSLLLPLAHSAPNSR